MQHLRVQTMDSLLGNPGLRSTLRQELKTAVETAGTHFTDLRPLVRELVRSLMKCERYQAMRPGAFELQHKPAFWRILRGLRRDLIALELRKAGKDLYLNKSSFPLDTHETGLASYAKSPTTTMGRP